MKLLRGKLRRITLMLIELGYMITDIANRSSMCFEYSLLLYSSCSAPKTRNKCDVVGSCCDHVWMLGKHNNYVLVL